MQLKDVNILVIDDNVQIRALLSNMLAGLVTSVSECPDGISGLGRWAAERPQLVLVDYEMPELSGPTFIKILRGQEAALGLRTAVLMITGHSDREHVVAALHAGADGFIVKPLAVEAILERAVQALEARAPRSGGGGVAYV